MPYLKAFEYESVMELLNERLDLLNASNADAEFVDDFIKTIKRLVPGDSEAMRCLVKGIFWLIKADGVESSQEIEMAMRIIKIAEVPIEDVFLEGLSNCKIENQDDEILLKEVETEDDDAPREIKILPEQNDASTDKHGDGIIKLTNTKQTIKMKI
jgi:hypothetical protein